jgi:FkbM family methyltransferase
MFKWRAQPKAHPGSGSGGLPSDLLRPYGDQPWWEATNLWEPTVRLALTDLCKPGSTVFDVGANLGGLTAVMSRLVGPRGTVVSFEASPRIFGHFQQNVIKQGFRNVFAVPRAAYFRSFEQVKIYHGDHLNDSIYSNTNSNPANYALVETVALDDFVEVVGVVPDTIKMDVEGAEYDALLGSAATIEKHRPHLILEQQTNDARCLDYLLERGYRALDLNSLRLINALADYPPNVGLRNVLFIHEQRVDELPFGLPVVREDTIRIASGDVRAVANGFVAGPYRLPAGRYVADMQFSAQGTDNEMICGASVDGQAVFQYHAYTRLLADSYRDWVFELPREADLELFFTYRSKTRDDTFSVGGGTVARIGDFRMRRNGRLLLK